MTPIIRTDTYIKSISNKKKTSGQPSNCCVFIGLLNKF